jgi:hypothetical protein
VHFFLQFLGFAGVLKDERWQRCCVAWRERRLWMESGVRWEWGRWIDVYVQGEVALGMTHRPFVLTWNDRCSCTHMSVWAPTSDDPERAGVMQIMIKIIWSLAFERRGWIAVAVRCVNCNFREKALWCDIVLHIFGCQFWLSFFE